MVLKKAMKPKLKLVPKSTPREEPKEEPAKRTRKPNKLPPDTYKPLFEPTRFLTREYPSKKDPTSMVRQFIEISVKRYEGDEENAPMVYIQMYQEAESYTGYMKGKTVYLPLEMLYTLIETLTDSSEQAADMGL